MSAIQIIVVAVCSAFILSVLAVRGARMIGQKDRVWAEVDDN